MLNDSYSDETLTAFLDGELDADDAERVRLALETDEALRARLAALEVPMGALRSGFDMMMLSAPDAPPLSRGAAGRGRWVQGRLVAVLLAGVMLGAGVGYWRAGVDASDWTVAVANYQALYVPRTLDAPAPEPAQVTARLSEMSQVLGRDLSAAAVAPGLDFRRAQVLGHEGAALIQMAYLSEDDVPFAICVMYVGGGDRSPKLEMLSDLASAHWVAGGFGFLVIGGEDLGFVADVAEELQERL